MHHGCLWQPGFHGCTCKEIISACGKAAHMCDQELEELTGRVAQTSEYNLRLQLDHPLLNTLQVDASNTPIPYDGNIPPEQFDWRIFDESPPAEATMAGECTPRWLGRSGTRRSGLACPRETRGEPGAVLTDA